MVLARAALTCRLVAGPACAESTAGSPGFPGLSYLVTVLFSAQYL